jgi:hypothetical protein
MSVQYGGDKITFADGSSTSSGYTGFKNRIINGAMAIDQRQLGAVNITNPSNNQYTVDRWQVNTGFTGLCGQNLGGVTPPPNFSNYLGMSVGASGQSASNYSFRQWIEGYNSADLAFGTANAKTVTLSFWVRSSLTGTFGGALQNEAGNRSYVYSYTITQANTWQYVTATIPGDTGGTWTGATNGYGIQVIISCGALGIRQGAAGSWLGGDYRTVTGAVDLITNNGATFYITGVQLEVGSSATTFEFRPYGKELMLCQRYYYYLTSSTEQPITNGCYYSSTNVYGVIPFPVTMRAAPTANITTGSSNYKIYRNSGPNYLNSLSIDHSTPTAADLYNSTEASGTAGWAGFLRTHASAAYIGFNAEL